MKVKHGSLPWLVSLIGVAPYLLLFAVLAYLRPPRCETTGFFGYDQPYYLANARAIFERGNGLAYPNPYDPDPQAPSIYFHWLIWAFGAAICRLGMDPGRLHLISGIAAALVFSRLTLAIVEVCRAGLSYRYPVFLLAMWGGGLATLLSLSQGMVMGPGAIIDFEPWNGLWMLYWGRNAMVTTEAVYHILMLGSWIALLKGRWRACLVCITLLATTHPFTGLQALAIFLTSPLSIGVGRRCGRMPLWFLVGLLVLASGFLGYYFGFLPRFPQHRAIQASWMMDWSEAPHETVAAYALVALLVLIRLVRDRWRVDRDGRFLLIAAGVSFLLSHHDRLIAPRQPLHFTHGYVWMPLFLFGVPVLRSVMEWASQRSARWVLTWALLALGCLDNATWILRLAHFNALAAGAIRDASPMAPLITVAYLPEDLAALYRRMAIEGVTGVILSDDPIAGYLAATYTACRPYYGHTYNTPDYAARRQRAHRWFRSGQDDAWIAGVDQILARGPLPAGSTPAWFRLLQSGNWALYRRRPAPTASASRSDFVPDDTRKAKGSER
jgi:hypothetical protein